LPFDRNKYQMTIRAVEIGGTTPTWQLIKRLTVTEKELLKCVQWTWRKNCTAVKQDSLYEAICLEPTQILLPQFNYGKNLYLKLNWVTITVKINNKSKKRGFLSGRLQLLSLSLTSSRFIWVECLSLSIQGPRTGPHPETTKPVCTYSASFFLSLSSEPCFLPFRFTDHSFAPVFFFMRATRPHLMIIEVINYIYRFEKILLWLPLLWYYYYYY
jgi:hypothetical protein